MSREIVKHETSELESVLIGGDLSKLSPPQRVEYYRRVCESLGLNPLTRPFEYITLNGRLTLYARKDAADQLRKINGVSIHAPSIEYIDDWIVVTVTASTPDGRTDTEVGVVNRKDMQGNFGNSLMKAVTKAKRRVTLSICGLGWLDETEIETIPDAKPVPVGESGEIVEQRIQSIQKSGKRPFQPDELREALLSSAEKMEEASAKMISEVAATLEYIYMSKDKRKMFLNWLTGKESLREVDKRLVSALHRWLKPVYQPENAVYVPTDQYAATEANTALNEYLMQIGQSELPPEGEQ